VPCAVRGLGVPSGLFGAFDNQRIMEIVSTANLTIVYDGDSVRAGAMDVDALAPSLLAAGTLLRKANYILNGENTHVSLKVRSDFRHGSFDVRLVLDQGLLQAAKIFLAQHPSIKDAKELLEIVFFYAGLPIGLFKLIRKMHGRRPENVEFQEGGDIVIVSVGTEKIEVNKTTFQLYSDPEVRRAADRLVAPLNSEGIDTLEIRREDEVERITKNDAESFNFSELEGERLLDNASEAWLSIIALSFKPEHKWRFSTGAGTITAEMKDETFWAGVHNRTTPFFEGDQLLVILRTTTVRDERGALRTRYTVERVLRHVKAPEQSRFDM
jgi:hypothetical protein